MKMINKPAGATSIVVLRLKAVLTVLLWIVIIGFSLYFFMDNVVAYFFGYRSRIFGDSLFHNHLWVVLHLAGGSLALLLGPVQLSLVSTCIPCRISLLLLTVFTLLATWFAWKAIMERDIRTHLQMMVRSYILVLAFVAVRIDDVFPLDFLFGAIEDKLFRRVVNEYFFSFVPLIIAEIVMSWWPAVYKKSEKSQHRVMV
jgi:hypothetical protein